MGISMIKEEGYTLESKQFRWFYLYDLEDICRTFGNEMCPQLRNNAGGCPAGK